MRGYRTVNLARAYWAETLAGRDDSHGDVSYVERMLAMPERWAGDLFNIIWC